VGENGPALWRDEGENRGRHHQAGDYDEQAPDVLPLPAAQEAHGEGEGSVHYAGKNGQERSGDDHAAHIRVHLRRDLGDFMRNSRNP
jgi:hypothetical protein